MTAGITHHFDHNGTQIAYRLREGAAPGVVWLGGFRSDMLGTKAEVLDQWAERTRHGFLRHDYSGHGESGGEFREGTISKWLAQSLDAFERFTSGKQILVGSSMGCWIALRMVSELRKAGSDRVAGLILLAPAPDFTKDLMEPKITPDQRRALEDHGFFEVASEYSNEPYVYTRALLEDGERNRVMTGPIDTHCPVHIIQGLADPDVPHSHALKLAGCLPADDVTVSLIPDGDHRLSRPQDLEMLVATVENMVAQVS